MLINLMFQYFTLFGNDLDSQLISTIDLTQQNSKVSSYQRILKTMSCKTSSLFKSLLINFYLSSICLTYLLKPIMFRLFMNISQDIKHLTIILKVIFLDDKFSNRDKSFD